MNRVGAQGAARNLTVVMVLPNLARSGVLLLTENKSLSKYMATQFYDDDLAFTHDRGFTKFARESAPGILDQFRSRGIQEGLVIDLGCGSGVWAKMLTDAGYSVLGIDVSAGMLKLARRHAPLASFRYGSFLDTDLPVCQAVTALGEVLSYAFDERVHLNTLKRFFHRVHSALQPGGVFIFDVVRSGGSRMDRRTEGYWEGEDWAVHVRFERDESAGLLTRRITTFRKVGRMYRKRHEVHRVRMYDIQHLARALRSAGFSVQTRRGYGEFRLRGDHVAMVARKR